MQCIANSRQLRSRRGEKVRLFNARANQYGVNKIRKQTENSHKRKFPRKENKRKNEGEEKASREIQGEPGQIKLSPSNTS